MSNINSIDKYGFSKHLYIEYWQKDFSTTDISKKSGADNAESLKKYLDLANPRKEILNIYKRYCVIDFKDYLESGYSHYLDETFNINFNRVK